MVSLQTRDHLSFLTNIFTAQKCDAYGHFLPDGVPPPPCALRPPNNWSPYCNRVEFEFANFIFTHAEMPAKKIDVLLEIWVASLIKLGGEPPFSNHTDLYNVIDSTSVGDVKWDNFTMHYKRGQQNNDAAGEAGVNEAAPWMYDMYDVWYRDLHQVIHNILATSEYKDEFHTRNTMPWMIRGAGKTSCLETGPGRKRY